MNEREYTGILAGIKNVEKTNTEFVIVLRTDKGKVEVKNGSSLAYEDLYDGRGSLWSFGVIEVDGQLVATSGIIKKRRNANKS